MDLLGPLDAFERRQLDLTLAFAVEAAERVYGAGAEVLVELSGLLDPPHSEALAA